MKSNITYPLPKGTDKLVAILAPVVSRMVQSLEVNDALNIVMLAFHSANDAAKQGKGTYGSAANASFWCDACISTGTFSLFRNVEL